MTTLVDVSQDAGNSSRAVTALEAEADEQQSLDAAKQQTQQKTDNSTEDRRFAGKNREEILDMYRNLESHQGSLANQLGQQRRTLDELLLAKRASDLQTNSDETSSTKLTAADLLERPTEALDRVVNARLTSALQPLEQQLRNLGSELASTRVVDKHGDWNATVTSSEFQSWAAKTPLRMSLVAQARGGSWQAADALLTEFKDRPQQVSADIARNAAIKAAEKAQLETTQAGSDGGTAITGKKIRRSDLWALRVNNPDKYDSMQPEILRAYKEGRIVD